MKKLKFFYFFALLLTLSFLTIDSAFCMTRTKKGPLKEAPPKEEPFWKRIIPKRLRRKPEEPPTPKAREEEATRLKNKLVEEEHLLSPKQRKEIEDKIKVLEAEAVKEPEAAPLIKESFVRKPLKKEAEALRKEPEKGLAAETKKLKEEELPKKRRKALEQATKHGEAARKIKEQIATARDDLAALPKSDQKIALEKRRSMVYEDASMAKIDATNRELGILSRIQLSKQRDFDKAKTEEAKEAARAALHKANEEYETTVKRLDSMWRKRDTFTSRERDYQKTAEYKERKKIVDKLVDNNKKVRDLNKKQATALVEAADAKKEMTAVRKSAAEVREVEEQLRNLQEELEIKKRMGEPVKELRSKITRTEQEQAFALATQTERQAALTRKLGTVDISDDDADLVIRVASD